MSWASQSILHAWAEGDRPAPCGGRPWGHRLPVRTGVSNHPKEGVVPPVSEAPPEDELSCCVVNAGHGDPVLRALGDRERQLAVLAIAIVVVGSDLVQLRHCGARGDAEQRVEARPRQVNVQPAGGGGLERVPDRLPGLLVRDLPRLLVLQSGALVGADDPALGPREADGVSEVVVGRTEAIVEPCRTLTGRTVDVLAVDREVVRGAALELG